MEVTALTLNCWGIAFVSKDRHERMLAIAEKLRSGQYDFVFLQEVWLEDDYRLIADKCHSVLPFSHYFHSGVVGAGVCILSVSPITEVFFHTWPVNGYIHKIHHGDWWSGKGVGICTVAHRGYNINLYVTHLHAEYNREDDEYCVHRISQGLETAQLINYTRHGVDLCILAGDLNTEPGDLPYKLIREIGGLEDSFLDTGKAEIEGSTNETPFNSYTAKESLEKCPNGKRIDYIMYLCRKGLKVKTIECFNPLPSRVEGQAFSYSDHEAVCSRLRISTSESHVTVNGPEKNVLQESLELCTTALAKLAKDQLIYWIISATVLVLLCALPDIPNWFLYYPVVILRIISILVCAYSCIMATIWNRMERHGIRATILSLTTRLETLTGKYSKLPVLERENVDHFH